MFRTNLRKVGGSVMLAVPPAMLDTLRLEPGGVVDLAIEKGRLIVAPQSRPRYTLEALISQCKPKRRRKAEERDWLDAPAVGGELI